MKKRICCVLVLLAGCSTGDRPSGSGSATVMKAQPTSYWIQQLKEADPDKRKFATTLLRDHALSDLGVRDELLAALKHDDADIRIGVIGVFAAMGWGGRDALPTLKILYRDTDERVSKAVVEAIRKIDESELPKIGVSRGQIMREK